MADEPAYQERYCAFVDILGFARLIERLRGAKKNVRALRDLLTIIHAPKRLDQIEWLATSELRVQSISDAVCISTAPTPIGLVHMYHAIEELSHQLLEQGYFIRGGIVRGRLYHDEKMVFGEAQVRAYRFEQDVAHYPRVVVAREVVKDTRKYQKDKKFGSAFADVLRQGSDGPYYLHILRTLPFFLQHLTGELAIDTFTEQINRMAGQIQRRFEESVDNPRHFEKLQWFARYWNDTVPGMEGIKYVAGPGA